MASSHSARPVSPPSTPPEQPSTEQPSTRQLGLKQVYPGSGHNGQETDITIVAIHGLGTESPKTWVAWKMDGGKKIGEVHWLQDPEMLPSVFPNARIFTYDWNANFDKDAQTEGLLGHANKLLEKLDIQRSLDSDDRPIFFIASCFGGLLLCRALQRASTEYSDYKHILNETGGILFIGTPFRGSDQSFVDVVNMRLAVAATSDEKNEELTRYLKSAESRDLDDIVREFTEMANSERRKLSIACLYETRFTNFTKSLNKIPAEFRKVLDNENRAILVPENSACLTGYRRSGLNVQHNMLNKFSRPDDEAFQTVCHYLGRLVEEAKPIVRRDELHNKIMQTLYVTAYLERKNRNSNPVKGTCDWFIEHRHFLKWCEAKTSSLLWVSANPGCGKSVLAKHLVRSLKTSSMRTVCYFFFKDIDDQRNVTSALSSVLHQLFEQTPALLSPEVIRHFESRNFNVNRSFDDLWHIIMLALEHVKTGEIVCVLDALDECELEGQKKLIEAIRNFYRTKPKGNSGSETSKRLKFLVTSRPDHNVELAFEPLDASEFSIVRLQGESPQELSKIEHSIDLFITDKVSSLQKKLALSAEEGSLLLERLRRHRNQTYTWVYLTLELIEKKLQISRSSILELTSSLPSEINDVYEKILTNIGDSHKEEAKKLLQIVVAAKRPLTLDEMSFAMALQTDHTCYNDAKANEIPMGRFPNYIRHLCGLFVNIIDSKIYLFHQTAKEFLIPSDKMEEDASLAEKKSPWKASLHPSESNRVISQICMRYLLFSDFKSETLESSQYCFFEYSAAHWAEHFRASHSKDADVVDSVLPLCDAGSLLCTNWFRVYWSKYSTRGAPKGFTSLMIASYFGIDRAVEILLRKEKGTDVTAQDSTFKRTALSWASLNGFNGVVKRLLKAVKMHPKNIASLSWYARDVVNSKDVFGRPALFYAVWNGHGVVVQTLLDAGAKADLEDRIGATPLSYALAAGQEAIVKMLSKSGTKESLEVVRRKLLLSAVKNEDVTVLIRLIKAGAPIETVNVSKKTLLAIAVVDNRTSSARFLVQHGANLEARGQNGRTPLHYAVEDRNEAMIKLLLHGGANPKAQDDNNRTPLHYAARLGREDERALLNHPTPSNRARNTQHITLLAMPAQHINEAVIKLLLLGGANLEAQDEKRRTPLHYAARHGNTAMMEFLLLAGANFEAQDEDGRTPLHHVVECREKAMIKLLLQAGASLEVRSKEGGTPLHYAAGDEVITKLLLQGGANPEA